MAGLIQFGVVLQPKDRSPCTCCPLHALASGGRGLSCVPSPAQILIVIALLS